jgi:hypothetical protein
MKIVKLSLLSTAIVCFALLLQNSVDEGGAASTPASVPSSPKAPSTQGKWEMDRGARPSHESIAPAMGEILAHKRCFTSTGTECVDAPASAPDRSESESKPLPVRVEGDGPTPGSPTPEPRRSDLSVESYSPAQNEQLEDLHQPIIIRFEQRQARPDIHRNAEDLFQISPPIRGQLDWRADHTLVFAPDPAWEAGTRYEVRLGEEWRTWFRTPRVIESVSPKRVVAAIAASPHTSIRVHFGLPVDRVSVEDAFTVSPTVHGRFRWTDDRRFVFEPETALRYTTTYHVTFDGEIRDATGVPLPGPSGWSFTTRSALVSAKPAGLVDIDSAVQLEFDTPMDKASVEAALVITPSVKGSFEWRENTLIFTPHDYFDPNTDYIATLRTLVRDRDGAPAIPEPYRWQFSTPSLPRTVDFGYGPRVQVLDADGRRAVRLTNYGKPTVTFRLFHLDVDRFLDRYTSSFRGIGPNEHQTVATGDLALTDSWEQRLERNGEAVIPSALAPGLYVLEAENGPGRDQLIIVLARHALVLKQSGGQLVTWAATIAEHVPAAGMHIRVYDRDGTLVTEGATEGRGLYRTVVPVDPDPLIVIGELNGDITVGGLGNEWQQGEGWWGWWQEDPEPPQATIYPYTDRPIYRPGQAVHMRAVIRGDDDAVYSLPAAAEVVLRLRDARDNVIATRNLTPDAFGAVYADFEVADGGTVGTYNLEVSALGETTRQPFLVEAYRKPDFEVTLTSATDHVVSGDQLSLTVQANYFFGQPVANAAVELVPYVGQDHGWYGGEPALDYGFSHEKLRQVGRTDAQGRLVVLLPATATNNADHQTWNIEATVTDASDLSVSGHTRVVVHRAGISLALHTGRYHYQPGEPIPVTALVRDHYGAAASGAPLTVGLFAWEGASGTYSRAVNQTQTLTDIDGEATAVLQTSLPGWYQIRAEGADAAGREVRAESWVWVYGAGSFWDTSPSGELRLSTDRDSYAPGDSVRLLVESPVSGMALLSFERGSVRRETVIHLDEGLNTLDFELLPDDVPNIHVAVAIWRPTAPADERWRWQSRPEQELLTARTEILVPADDKQLTVTITPDSSAYTPRDVAALSVEIRDSAGRPVQAGFSLALVDEAIFALAADNTPHIFDAFYRSRPDLVRTYHSLRPTRWLDWGLGGGGGGGEALAGSPRSDFPDTAYWAPALTTDADGRAVVQVPLPDSLTSWRAVVRAVTARTEVGQASAGITVALPLSVQPVLPRFLIQGDQALLTAVVHNHTGLTRTATAQLTAQGVELVGSALNATQQFRVPANGTVALGWRVTATEAGEGQVRVDVSLLAGTGEPWQDAVVLPLPVVPRAVPEVTTVPATVEGNWIATVDVPDAAIPDLSRWELSLAPSIANGMLDGLEYLIDYPFG